MHGDIKYLIEDIVDSVKNKFNLMKLVENRLVLEYEKIGKGEVAASIGKLEIIIDKLYKQITELTALATKLIEKKDIMDKQLSSGSENSTLNELVWILSEMSDDDLLKIRKLIMSLKKTKPDITWVDMSNQDNSQDQNL